MKQEVKEVLTKMMNLLDDPKATPEDRATYMNITGGLTSTLTAIQDPDVTPEDRAAYIGLVKAMNGAVIATLAPSPPQSHASQMPKKRALRAVGENSAGLREFHSQQSAPEDPKDRKKIQKKIEETFKAFQTAQDPNASPKEKKDALRKVKQQIEALKSSEYLELMKEIKRYKPSATCAETVENRTRQVGWSDGSLWGLSGSACAATVAAGASQERTEWHALFACVQRNPFSSCVDHVPGD
ncbi:hypothetical protein [Streptomyces sp. NPDC056452]|uniref:hypothetical protein n=1 Tax=Streptomyces sp. NPDC056452 TaxID=3345821 RepID=UPI00369EE96B